ncbi:Ferredoxin-related [Quillaja saponaria]|uniref:Ferredoxin-related n=1 Tax=Quillaja saponaria TaxID=32244 RepID=A0AAD7PCN0_QUISA|nr:Ferredoxin-related [Quillaja saponaria]
MMMKKLFCCEWFILSHLLVAAYVYSKEHGNPTNDLVDIINKNRTVEKLPQLNDSPGLGCMALQYIKLCEGNCTGGNAVNCKPPEDDFTEVFAPNCGVELPTFGTITGHIVGCQSKYLEPSLAFSRVLVKDKHSLSLLRNKSHTEVGVGMVGVHKGPFFWCILFSNGQTNSTFVLENHGAGIKQNKGCFSGSSICSWGQNINPVFLNIVSLGILSFLLLKPL